MERSSWVRASSVPFGMRGLDSSAKEELSFPVGLCGGPCGQGSCGVPSGLSWALLLPLAVTCAGFFMYLDEHASTFVRAPFGG